MVDNLFWVAEDDTICLESSWILPDIRNVLLASLDVRNQELELLWLAMYKDTYMMVETTMSSPLSPPIKTSPALFIMFAKTDYLSGSVQPPPSLPWTSSWTSSTRSPPTSLFPKCSLVSFVLSSLHQQMACTVQGSLRPGSRKTHY